MSLCNPAKIRRFQPAFVLETVWQMLDAGLDYSCYYHIRDYYVDVKKFSEFMSPQGAAFMARWWNRMPQYDGLFDYQNTVRPAYYRIQASVPVTGKRLRIGRQLERIHSCWLHSTIAIRDAQSAASGTSRPTPCITVVGFRDVPHAATLMMDRSILDANAPSYRRKCPSAANLVASRSTKERSTRRRSEPRSVGSRTSGRSEALSLR